MLLQGGHVQRNPSKALTYFQRALDRGVAAAANALGVMHAVGVGVPASMAAARSWFEQGANMSSSEAYFNLGTIYLHGECHDESGRQQMLLVWAGCGACLSLH